MNKQTTDAEIVELYWNRDETAISRTDEKYGRYLHRLAYNILADDGDCEECKNDTYLDVWQAIPPTRPNVFAAFITEIMRRIATDRYREKTRKKRIPSELMHSMEELEYGLRAETVEETCDAARLGDLISRYLRTQPKRRRFIFMSRFYASEKICDIAVALGVSESAVYKELSKIKEGLRRYLESEGVTI